jgi:YfiH family protein
MPALAPSVHLRRGSRDIHIRCSTSADGDFHIERDPIALRHRRQAFERGRWTQLDEVHGTTVHVVEEPGQHDFAVGDAAVTWCLDAVLGVWVGDCAPVVLVGDHGVAAVHAGWRGALDGILQRAVAALGEERVEAVLGPCIAACCNEFGPDLLQQFVDRFGPVVEGTTSWGTPSLDLPAVTRAALAEVGVPLTDLSSCTRCHPERYFSHRRGQLQRQVMTVRMMEAE